MDLAALAAEFSDRFLKRVTAVAEQHPPLEVADATMHALQITEAALRRGVLAGHIEFDLRDDDPLAFMFAMAFAMGEGAALRRAKVGLSDPKAKGRALETLDRLIAGDEIETALRPGSRPAQPAAPPAGAVVIPLHPKS